MEMVDNNDLPVFLADFGAQVSGLTEKLLTRELDIVKQSKECKAIKNSCESFLTELESSLMDLQKKCIFLSLVFLDNLNPSVNDINLSCENLKDSVRVLYSVVSNCPMSIGRTLLNNWNLFLRNVCQSLVEFVNSLSKSVAASDSSQVKASIGKLCHDVGGISKISKTNMQAARISVQSR